MAETQENYVLVLALAIIPILILINILKHYPKPSPISLPPGPTPWPIIGNIRHLIGSNPPHVALANLAKTYGPLVSLRLGIHCVIVASSHEAAREILKNNDRILCGRHIPQPMQAAGLELNKASIGWAEECTDNWKLLRNVCKKELFSNKALEINQAEKHLKKLVSFLSDRQGQVLKIADPVFATLFNTLTEAMMSRSDLISLQGDGGLKRDISTVQKLSASIDPGHFYPIFNKLDFQGLRAKVRDSWIRIQAVWEPIISERRNERNATSLPPQDLLDALLDNGFANHHISQLFTELVTAGTDTITAVIEWTLAEVLKNPECLLKLRAEIQRSDQIKQDQLHDYLEACVKETMRLHTPAPFPIPHRALETCQVMNYTVPKNALVMINLWAISRDPSVWEEPLRYNPERFVGSSVDFRGNDFELIPFGSGRRMCPAIPMASKMIPWILISLVQFFDFSLPDGSHHFPAQHEFDDRVIGDALPMKHPLMLLFQARS